ncbi:hypothetical protein B0H13DRAFT_2331783 [Mycena leptocephala]|nr:hypothetical protein B0H13DRAFT_2331783 [Mycena leptocephala]
MAVKEWTANKLGLKHFHKSEEMQNSSHWKTYCKGCVDHHLITIKAARVIVPVDAATRLLTDAADFGVACTRAGSVRGQKDAWITHVLGSLDGKTSLPCAWASAGAKAEATTQQGVSKTAKDDAPSNKHARSASTAEADDATTKKKMKQSLLNTYTGHSMPFSSSDADAIQSQALRAIVSTNSAFGLFEDPEMLTLFGMMRSRAPDLMPAQEKLSAVLDGQEFGASADGWKALTKDSVNGSYTIELVDVTSMDKSGAGMCTKFGDIIDRIEAKYNCKIIYFITDADGGSEPILNTGSALNSSFSQFQLILGDYFKVHKFAAQTAETATALIGWINSHGKVRKIFDAAQRSFHKDRIRQPLFLAYLVANLMRWTTHCIAFMRLFRAEEPLQLAVMQSKGAIVAAQVGAATGAEKIAFTEEASSFCTLIMDASFWSCLESLIEDIEPICYGTNINQKDSTRADQVLLSLIGMFLRMAAHPEPDVAKGMTARLEKRWKDCDQPLFLLTLILNPFEQLSCFGPRAGLNHFSCLNLVVSMYRRMQTRPDNKDTIAERKAKEKSVSTAFLRYLARTHAFAPWKGDEPAAQFEEQMLSLFSFCSCYCQLNIPPGRDPIAVWEAFKTEEIAELTNFAITILKVVVNQAGCERVFSDLKELEKMTKIGADIKSDHQQCGLVKLRAARKVHKSTAALLTVPQYRDLVQDQDDDDRGPAVISTVAGHNSEPSARRAHRTFNAPEEDLDVVHSTSDVRKNIISIVNSTWDTDIAAGMANLPSIIAPNSTVYRTGYTLATIRHAKNSPILFIWMKASDIMLPNGPKSARYAVAFFIPSEGPFHVADLAFMLLRFQDFHIRDCD